MAYFQWVRLHLLVGFAAAIAMAAGAAQADTSVCTGNEQVFDWSDHGWTDGDLTNSYTHAGTDLDWTISGNTEQLAQPLLTRESPYISDAHTGGTGSAQDALFLRTDFDNASQSIDVTVELGRPGEGVAAFDMTLFDVDLGVVHVDHVTVTASLDGVAVPVTLTAGLVVLVTGNTAVGIDPLALDTGAGNVAISIAEPVDKVEITYFNALAVGILGLQHLYVHDVEYCDAIADVNADKRVEMADGGVGYAIPGADVEIVFDVENVGAGWVDDGSLVLIDSISPEMAFRNEIFPGATGPVVFNDNASGMTFSDATDVAYSSASAKPSNFAECNYVPQPGYDPAVRHVCVYPKGALRGASTGRGFELKFAAQVQ